MTPCRVCSKPAFGIGANQGLCFEHRPARVVEPKPMKPPRQHPSEPVDLEALRGLEPNVTEYAIEKGIPVSAEKSNRVRLDWNPGEFPFEAMEVGDSFAVRPPLNVDMIYVQNKMTGAASKLHREGSKRFTTRQQMDGTIRCWRIK